MTEDMYDHDNNLTTIVEEDDFTRESCGSDAGDMDRIADLGDADIGEFLAALKITDEMYAYYTHIYSEDITQKVFTEDLKATIALNALSIEIKETIDRNCRILHAIKSFRANLYHIYGQHIPVPISAEQEAKFVREGVGISLVDIKNIHEEMIAHYRTTQLQQAELNLTTAQNELKQKEKGLEAARRAIAALESSQYSSYEYTCKHAVLKQDIEESNSEEIQMMARYWLAEQFALLGVDRAKEKVACAMNVLRNVMAYLEDQEFSRFSFVHNDHHGDIELSKLELTKNDCIDVVNRAADRFRLSNPAMYQAIQNELITFTKFLSTKEDQLRIQTEEAESTFRPRLLKSMRSKSTNTLSALSPPRSPARYAKVDKTIIIQQSDEYSDNNREADYYGRLTESFDVCSNDKLIGSYYMSNFSYTHHSTNRYDSIIAGLNRVYGNFSEKQVIVTAIRGFKAEMSLDEIKAELESRYRLLALLNQFQEALTNTYGVFADLLVNEEFEYLSLENGLTLTLLQQIHQRAMQNQKDYRKNIVVMKTEALEAATQRKEACKNAFHHAMSLKERAEHAYYSHPASLNANQADCKFTPVINHIKRKRQISLAKAAQEIPSLDRLSYLSACFDAQQADKYYQLACTELKLAKKCCQAEFMRKHEVDAILPPTTQLAEAQRLINDKNDELAFYQAYSTDRNSSTIIREKISNIQQRLKAAQDVLERFEEGNIDISNTTWKERLRSASTGMASNFKVNMGSLRPKSANWKT